MYIIIKAASQHYVALSEGIVANQTDKAGTTTIKSNQALFENNSNHYFLSHTHSTEDGLHTMSFVTIVRGLGTGLHVAVSQSHCWNLCSHMTQFQQSDWAALYIAAVQSW